MSGCISFFLALLSKGICLFLHNCSLNDEIMYKIRFVPFLLGAVLMLLACGGGKAASSAVAAYDTATEKVMLAGSTEELVEASYALHLELAGYAGSSRNVREARQRFETAVKEKTVELYSAPHTKK